MVFALAVLDGYTNKEGLIHSRRCSIAVTGGLEWTIIATTFCDVAHRFVVLSYHLRYIDAATAIR